MDKENMMHEITQQKQLQVLAFEEETYMKTRPEFIYEHGVIDSQAIQEFLARGSKGELNKYYKSEEKHPLANIRPTTGKTFSRDILEDGKDHIVYEYSEYCPTCKKISPYLSLLVDYVEKKGKRLSMQVWVWRTSSSIVWTPTRTEFGTI
jgi:thiol-disulfide isomerase/thioredoxin